MEQTRVTRQELESRIKNKDDFILVFGIEGTIIDSHRPIFLAKSCRNDLQVDGRFHGRPQEVFQVQRNLGAHSASEV